MQTSRRTVLAKQLKIEHWTNQHQSAVLTLMQLCACFCASLSSVVCPLLLAGSGFIKYHHENIDVSCLWNENKIWSEGRLPFVTTGQPDRSVRKRIVPSRRTGTSCTKLNGGRKCYRQTLKYWMWPAEGLALAVTPDVKFHATHPILRIILKATCVSFWKNSKQWHINCRSNWSISVCEMIDLALLLWKMESALRLP